MNKNQNTVGVSQKITVTEQKEKAPIRRSACFSNAAGIKTVSHPGCHTDLTSKQLKKQRKNFKQKSNRDVAHIKTLAGITYLQKATTQHKWEVLKKKKNQHC